MAIWEGFHEKLLGRHEYAREWKREGGKVLGYLCSYVPEEIVYAAGVLPVRILGGHQPQDVTERHIFSMWCPYCRDCLAQGLLGRYDYLDALAHAHSCQHIRQTFDSWQKHIPLEFSYEIPFPAHIASPYAHRFLVELLREFKGALEKWLDTRIDEAALTRAIEVYNTSRGLLRQIYELRKFPTPPITGMEAMEVVLAGLVMDKAEYNRMLKEALDQASGQEGGSLRNSGPRLIVLGSENDDVELIRLVESLGAQVVIDEHCTGSRYFWNDVILDGDPILAIAARYLDRPPCPQKDFVTRRRFSHALGLAREWSAHGAIYILEKFCDPYEYEVPGLQSLFQENGIPMLLLEVDSTIPVGQFRTRIEAFLEALELEVG